MTDENLKQALDIALGLATDRLDLLEQREDNERDPIEERELQNAISSLTMLLSLKQII